MERSKGSTERRVDRKLGAPAPLVTAAALALLCGCTVSIESGDFTMGAGFDALPHHRTVVLRDPLPGGELEIDTGFGSIGVMGMDQDEVIFECILFEKVPGDAELLVEDGRLELRSRGGNRVRLGDVKATVPRGTTLYLDSGSGNVSVMSLRGTNSLFVDTGSGDIALSGIRGAGRIDVDTGSGDVRIETVSDAERIVIDTGSGDVEVNAVVARSLEAEAGSGDVTIRNATLGDVSLDTGSGDILFEGTTYATLRMDSGSGGFSVK